MIDFKSELKDRFGQAQGGALSFTHKSWYVNAEVSKSDSQTKMGTKKSQTQVCTENSQQFVELIKPVYELFFNIDIDLWVKIREGQGD